MSAEQMPANLELLPPNRVFPLAYGCEEETGLMDDISGDMDEPYVLVGDLVRYVPKDFLIHDTGRGTIFTESGFKLYPGGSLSTFQPTNMECATPEVRSLEDLVRFIRGSELLRHKVILSYAEKTSQALDRPFHVRMQRRTVDGEGSRKACHKNFGLPWRTHVGAGKEIPEELLTTLAVSSILGGAGLVDEDGTYFSGKVPGLMAPEGYGYRGYMYRKTTDEVSPRFEVRHSDANFSPWQIVHDTAFTALSVGICNTPLRTELIATPHAQAVKRAKSVNRLNLQPDGTIVESRAQRMAIGHIQKVAELALSKMLLYVEYVPDELERAASQLYEFGDDLTKIMNGEATISLLADRTDWAAKFEIILHRMGRDQREDGKARTLTDFDSQADDMRYDFKGYTAEKGKAVKVVEGYGYKLRERGKFRDSPTAFIDTTLRQPPKGTRAAARTELMRDYDVVTMDWHKVQILDDKGFQTFIFPQVLEGLSDRDREVLASVPPRSK